MEGQSRPTRARLSGSFAVLHRPQLRRRGGAGSGARPPHSPSPPASFPFPASIPPYSRPPSRCIPSPRRSHPHGCVFLRLPWLPVGSTGPCVSPQPSQVPMGPHSFHVFLQSLVSPQLPVCPHSFHRSHNFHISPTAPTSPHINLKIPRGLRVSPHVPTAPLCSQGS